MKKVMAVILAVVMLLSMVSVTAFASDIDVTISGRKTTTQAAFTVNLKNMGAESADAVVYVATFENDTSFKNVEKYPLELAAGASTNNVYLADITNGTAKIFVWDEGIIPLGTPASDDCAVVDSLDGEKIEVSQNDVWVSNTGDGTKAVDSNTNTQ